MAIEDMRREYMRAELTEDAAAADPVRQLAAWLEEAAAAGVTEPNAMTLATASADGVPSARMVLLKGVDDRGLVFYTNYGSRKGDELAANPRAALVLYWAPLERQVRVEGRVEKVSREESAAYFASRPRGSRLGALASPQSAVVAGRSVLEERLAELETAHPGEDVPLPDNWGGYLVVPEVVELWQGRPNRLHDRLRYRADGRGGWIRQRLAP
jgi:pyridoxamine 5'-phosphate oxidase